MCTSSKVNKNGEYRRRDTLSANPGKKKKAPAVNRPLNCIVPDLLLCGSDCADHYSHTQREESMARLRSRLREIWKVRAKRDVGEATLPA
jgi:hypothetical protein